MNRREFLQTTTLAALAPRLAWGADAASETQQERQTRWIELAEGLKPQLRETRKLPQTVVQPIPDSTRFLRWRMEEVTPASALNERLMRDGDEVILDFGEHMTGHFTFSLVGEGRGVDSPARIRLVFGEVPAGVAEPLDQYHGGLSRAWLQDEVINIDVLPATIRMPRRYAFRYVKLQVVAVSPNYGVRFNDAKATALTSAGTNQSPIPPSTPEELQRIDEVSLATLRDCMQTVFEDGPKRDQRVWIGDMRLQALVNYDTFRNNHLVKRCLYLFAGLPREDGLVPACVFEHPHPLRGHEYIMDYAALYVAMVLDYARATNDWDTANDLWPAVRRQIEILSGYAGDSGVFSAPAGSWVFVDWKDDLDRTAPMHGIFVFALRQARELARSANAPAQVAEYTQRIDRMTASARESFWDAEAQVFVSGPKRQVSWATQAWMALAGIASPTEGAKALRTVMNQPEAVRPGGPYLHHYFVEAMIQCGLRQEAVELVQSYWGGMVNDGADTFWEVYDPAQPLLSPYGDPLVNSYCHAWSCTPAYLFRSGGLI